MTTTCDDGNPVDIQFPKGRFTNSIESARASELADGGPGLERVN
jgi:hypothetical protein